MEGVGWIAARCLSQQRTAWDHLTWAHTSPVYLRSTFDRKAEAIDATRDQLQQAIDWVQHSARFDDEQQRLEVIDLYRDALAQLGAMEPAG